MSDKTTHTPGPWRISQNVSRHVIGPKGGVVTCGELTWDGPGSTAIADANARLIAAAPELLEALRTLAVEEYRDDDDPILGAARDKARAAIAKATEQS